MGGKAGDNTMIYSGHQHKHACLGVSLIEVNGSLEISCAHNCIISPQRSRKVVPHLGSLDILGLNLPEAFATSCAGKSFSEL